MILRDDEKAFLRDQRAMLKNPQKLKEKLEKLAASKQDGYESDTASLFSDSSENPEPVSDDKSPTSTLLVD